MSPFGGDEGVRTPDPLLAKQVLSQLSYTPIIGFSMKLPSFRRSTSKIKQYHSLKGPCRQPVLLNRCPDLLLRKEVIQPQVLLRLPCYDFTPITDLTFGGVLLAVRLPTSGASGSHGVTGGVYKARERIHRGMLIRDY